MKPFEIFRTGTHTATNGSTADFGEAMLADVVASYDPARHEAPLVVGHPKTDGPAYGWVRALEVRDGKLVAVPGDVADEFADLVKARRYAKVSASFFRPDAPNSPAPGHWYLRHVGFLGAAAPAVKGLRPIEFADAPEGVTTVEFAAPAGKSLLRRLVEMLSAEAEIEPATAEAAFAAPLHEEEVEMPKEAAAADAQALAQREADLAAREARVKADQDALAAQGRASRAVEDAAFVDQVVADGRLPIGLRGRAVALFAQLDEGTVSFADAGATVEQPAREALRGLLAAIPTPVVTGEIAKGEAASVDFADPLAIAGAITAEISAAAGAGETISPAEALQRIHTKGAKA